MGLRFAFYQIYTKYYRNTATLSSYNETMIIKKHKSFGVESFSNESFTFKLRIIKCLQHSLKLCRNLEVKVD